jgi:hypothetical protein
MKSHSDAQRDHTTGESPSESLAARIINQLFRLALVVSLIAGAAMTFGQLIGVVVGQGSWLIALEALLAIPTYVGASIAGLLAFVELYTRGSTKEH